METKLNFTIKNVYGRDLAYPQNKQALLACKIVGRKSLNMDQIQTLQAMGFEIIQVPMALPTASEVSNATNETKPE